VEYMAPLPGHPGEIISDNTGIAVKINRRAYQTWPAADRPVVWRTLVL